METRTGVPIGTREKAPTIIPEVLTIGSWFGLPAYTATALAVSLLVLAVGFLAGRGGLPFFVGGALAYWVIAPCIANFFVTP